MRDLCVWEKEEGGRGLKRQPTFSHFDKSEEDNVFASHRAQFASELWNAGLVPSSSRYFPRGLRETVSVEGMKK